MKDIKKGGIKLLLRPEIPTSPLMVSAFLLSLSNHSVSSSVARVRGKLVDAHSDPLGATPPSSFPASSLVLTILGSRKLP